MRIALQDFLTMCYILYNTPAGSLTNVPHFGDNPFQILSTVLVNTSNTLLIALAPLSTFYLTIVLIVAYLHLRINPQMYLYFLIPL